MNDAAQPLIRLDKVTEIFFTDAVETHALAEIDLDIYLDEYIAISGPSGCGKSTLLSILGLLDHLHGHPRPRYAQHAGREVHLSTGRWWTASRARAEVRRGSGARGGGQDIMAHG